MNKLTTSIIIVTHNRPAKLIACINSILGNTVLPDEIIIIDDSDPGKDSIKKISDLISSRDKPAKLTAKNFYIYKKIKFIYRRIFPSRGVSFSRNLGIKNSRSEIIVFIDDDCLAHEDWIESTIASHLRYRKIPAITGLVFPMYPENYWNQVLSRFHLDLVKKPKETHFLYGANYSFKSDIFKVKKIYFNQQMIYCSEDRYMSYMMMRQGYKMMYDPSIKVTHEFRTKLTEVYPQWFRYGRSDYYFWKYTPDYNLIVDADYFRKAKKNLSTIIFAPLRVGKRIYEMLEALEIHRRDLKIIPGLILIFIFYYIGVYFALHEDKK